MRSQASAFWSDDFAAAAYKALISAEVRGCLLEGVKSKMTQDVGEEGFLVANASSEVVDTIVPYGYGTVLLFKLTLPDANVAIPVEFAVVLVGKGSVLTFMTSLGFGNYDVAFLVTAVAKVMSCVESLTPGGAAITQ